MVLSELTDQRLDAHLQSGDIVLIDFNATWCAPCRSFSDAFVDIAGENQNLVFYMVDVEQQPDMAKAFEVTSVPHLVILKSGIAIYSEAGAISRKTLQELIENAKQAKVPSSSEQIEEG